MTVMRRCALCLISMTALAGCGPDGRPAPKWVDRQVPAPVQPAPPPPVRNVSIDPSLLTAAKAELNAGLGSKMPEDRMHAIEAMQQTIGVAAKDVYLKGLSSEMPEVRYASAMAIGHLQIAEAKEPLTQMVNDGDGNVYIAVRFALHRLGDTRFSKDLQTTARDPLIWQHRAMTAMLLGYLNEPTAVRILKPMQKDDQAAVRIQVAEALWRMGEMDGLTSLVGAAQSKFDDDQLIALMGLTARKDARVLVHIRPSLTAEHLEVRLMAARAMGILGSDAGYGIAAGAVGSKDVRQRALAALALGAIGRSDAQPLLAGLLKDADSADVRLSAAQALLQLKPPGTTARIQ